MRENSLKRFSGSLMLLLFLLCKTYLLSQQTPYPGIGYWTVTMDLPAGAYHGDGLKKFCVVGGNPAGNNIEAPYAISGTSISANFAPGSLFRNVRFRIANAILSAKGCKFVNCHFEGDRDGRVVLEDCVLFDCVLSVPSIAEGNTWTTEKATISMKNCVIAQSVPQYLGPNGRSAILRPRHQAGGSPAGAGQTTPEDQMIPSPKAVLQWQNCTFMGRGILNSFVDIDSVEYAKICAQAGSFVRNCTFKEFCVGLAPLLLSAGSSFENCELPSHASDKTKARKISLTAHVEPEDHVKKLNTLWPKLQIVLADKAKAGANIQADLSTGVLVDGLQVATGPAVSVLSVLAQPGAPAVPVSPASVATSSPGAPRAGGMPPSLSPGSVTGTIGAPEIGLKTQLAHVHGLLIMSLDRGEAGSASKMSAAALDMDKSMPSVVVFNQQVGDMMSKALAEVAKFTQLRNKGWPKGYRIELSFADKYSDKDGPSAAVASALLLNSLITGKENDPAFAVTGDMNVDGSVQPIGGVAAKIRGATNGNCKVVAIPAKNESALNDLLLTDGPAPFAKIQIYSVSTFDEAEALALKDKPAATQNAIAQMAAVQEVLLRDPAQIAGWLRNQHVLARLQAVQQAAPNNLSARYLLRYATGKVPQTLSLAGSLDALDQAASDLISSIKSNRGKGADVLRKDVVGSSITRLQNLRAKCDMRVRAYAETLIRFGAAVKEIQDRPPNSAARATVLVGAIDAAADSADAEYKRLMGDPKILEELKQ